MNIGHYIFKLKHNSIWFRIRKLFWLKWKFKEIEEYRCLYLLNNHSILSLPKLGKTYFVEERTLGTIPAGQHLPVWIRRPISDSDWMTFNKNFTLWYSIKLKLSQTFAMCMELIQND